MTIIRIPVSVNLTHVAGRDESVNIIDFEEVHQVGKFVRVRRRLYVVSTSPGGTGVARGLLIRKLE